MPPDYAVKAAREWIIKAKNDLLNADNNLSAAAIPFDTVCFHCHQAAGNILLWVKKPTPEDVFLANSH